MCDVCVCVVVCVWPTSLVRKTASKVRCSRTHSLALTLAPAKLVHTDRPLREL